MDMDIKGDIKNLVLGSIGDKFPHVEFNVAETKFADYQCSVALSLSKKMKDMGITKTPKEVALEIVADLPKNEIVSKAEPSGPGFINFSVKKEYFVKYFDNVRRKRCVPAPVGNGEAKVCRAVVDFSSPNIAKEMHVGHLRSTIIGDSICRLFEYMEIDVLRLNHVGDWGTQFGMLIAHLMDQPEIKMEIEELQKIYKEAKTKFDSDAEFKKRSYDYVVRLQASDPEVRRTWTSICDVSRKQFADIYERLNVKIDERGESFYQKLMEELVVDLKERGELIEDEGRWILWSGKDKVPLTIVKSDGGFTYDTSDLAALRHRVEVEKANWIIYVVDMGQGPHFENIFNCAEKLGYSKKETTKLSFVGFGVVLDESKKKFKTRSGDTVKLKDLLDEGLKRAKETLEKKDRHLVLSEDELKAAQEAVAYGCIKYADLCNNRVSEYVFSFDKMLQEKGNTAVYLLYAYTRIKSIIRNSNIDIDALIDSDEPLSFEHEKEWKLAKTLAKFNETIKKVQETLCLHFLCEYVYNVATTFTEFYDSCYCMVKDATGTIVSVDKNRILLCQITCYFMQQTFDILGLKYVEKM